MTTIIEALYNWAASRPNTTRWLHDEDIVAEYESNGQFMGMAEATLLKTLSSEDLDVFDRYIENRNMREELQNEMIFAQGVAIGVYLGTLRP